MQIIVKQSYRHINRSFSGWDTPKGRKVESKAHYEALCKEQNMVPYEQAEEMAKRNAGGKEYKLSQASQAIINECKAISRPNGKINLKERPKMIEKMIKGKIIQDNSKYLKYLPAAYQPKGGFTNV